MRISIDAKSGAQAGWTSIELILTILLLGIFAVISVNSMDLSQPSSRTALLMVAHDLRYAQNRAMTTGVLHGFRTLGTTSYEIYQGGPGNPVPDPTTRSAMQVDLQKSFKGVQFVSTYQVEFDAKGIPTLGGGTQIQMQAGNVTRSFTVVANTGLVDLP